MNSRTISQQDLWDMPLRQLREDIALYRGPTRRDGSPTWTLHDPARNRFFRIGWLEFQLLSAWGGGTVGRVVEQVRQSTTLRASAPRVLELIQFLSANQLLEARDEHAREQLIVQRQAMQQRIGRWLLHNYLFFRIPLVHPDRFLDATLPYLRFVFTRGFALALGAALLLAIFLVSRQWDSFVHTFGYLFSWEGMAVFAVMLFLSKAAHELGHAYTAKRYGVRIPTMGLAFLVLWPVLYTDTSEAWKLPDRGKRIAIASAGTLAELGLAAFATLTWSFLPDGPLRGAVFMIATATWVLTLIVNLNPLMRFDGYYLLSDILEVENLQDRAFALGRWQLRRLLLGLEAPCPEPLPTRLRRILIAFSWAVWTYRFFLFLGIAILVYLFFFKLAGIFLMMTELTWFIGLPIYRELRAWWRLRKGVRWNRTLARTLLGLAGLLLAALLPWSHHVELPGLLLPQVQSRVYAPAPGLLREVRVAPGDPVQAGDLIFRLASPEATYQLEQAQTRIQVLRLQIERTGGNPELLDLRLVLEEQLGEARAALQAATDSLDQLSIRAPISGVVSELEEWLQPGRWLGEKQPLALIVQSDGAQAEALVSEQDLGRLSLGATGRFYPENTDLPPVEVRLERIDRASLLALSRPYLASVYGGAVPVRKDASDRLAPEQSLYRLSLATSESPPAPQRIERGTLRLAAEARSPVRRLWDAAMGVLVRESGF